MSCKRSSVLLFVAILSFVGAFAVTANAATNSNVAIFAAGNTVLTGSGGSASTAWGVPDYTALTIKQTTGSIPTETALRELLEESFDEVDTNNDGYVSFAEAGVALPGLTQETFDAVDANGDGYISPDEVESGGCSGCSGGIGGGLGDIVLAALAMIALAIFGQCIFCH